MTAATSAPGLEQRAQEMGLERYIRELDSDGLSDLLLGWIVLHESLTPRELLGMALTVGGVTWVVRERVPDDVGGSRAPSPWGVALASSMKGHRKHNR